jgi:hypothetical protein
MKKLLLIFTLSISFSGFSQITLFEDSFETYESFNITTFGEWDGLDLDLLNTYNPSGYPVDFEFWPTAGELQAFMVFSPGDAAATDENLPCTGTTETRSFAPRTGTKYVGCWAGVPNSNQQTATANNDWLISPVIELGLDNTISFWVKNLSNCYGNELYRVGIYIGNGTPTSPTQFIIIGGAGTPFSASFPNWTLRSVSIPASFNSQQVRIGIQCVSADAYFFMVDDFKVTATTLGVNENLNARFSMYPNPASTVISIANLDKLNVKSVSIADLNGRIMKTVALEGVDATDINVSDLAAGVYLINIATEEGIATKKFIKN